MIEPFVLEGITPTSGREIGRGAWGRSFQVIHRGTNYAAKEIHSVLVECANTPEEVKRLKDRYLRESYLLSEFRHPNVIQFVGVYYPKSGDKLDGFPTIVMEQMNCSLSVWTEQNIKRLHSALSILHDVSLGLWYLHSRNPPVMHCDLTPNNVLVNTSSVVAKIAGFGNASEGSTGDVLIPGTTIFMLPEAFYRPPQYGLPLDVFSYGGVALYAVVGEWPSPFDKVKFDPKTKERVVLSEVERRQQYLDKMIGEAEVLRQLVEECLDNDPAVRPTIEVVSTRINETKTIYMEHHPESEVTLLCYDT